MIIEMIKLILAFSAAVSVILLAILLIQYAFCGLYLARKVILFACVMPFIPVIGVYGLLDLQLDWQVKRKIERKRKALGY